MFVLNLKTFFTVDEDFDWKQACIQREQCSRVWSDPDTQTQAIIYKDTIFAPVDSVHLMEVPKLKNILFVYVHLLKVKFCTVEKKTQQ